MLRARRSAPPRSACSVSAPRRHSPTPSRSSRPPGRRRRSTPIPSLSQRMTGCGRRYPSSSTRSAPWPRCCDRHDVDMEGAELEAANRVGALLTGHAPLGVAFSGGVDSATLLALAARSLGRQRVLAVLGVSPSLAADERAAAHEVAASIGVRIVEVATFEGDRAAYR